MEVFRLAGPARPGYPVPMRRRDFSLALMGSAMPLLALGGKPGGSPALAATTHAAPAALQRLAERLHRLEEDGLNPSDYTIPAETAVAAVRTTAAATARPMPWPFDGCSKASSGPIAISCC